MYELPRMIDGLGLRTGVVGPLSSSPGGVTEGDGPFEGVNKGGAPLALLLKRTLPFSFFVGTAGLLPIVSKFSSDLEVASSIEPGCPPVAEGSSSITGSFSSMKK